MKNLDNTKKSIQKINPDFSDELLDLLYEYFFERNLNEALSYHDNLRLEPDKCLELSDIINKCSLPF